ncbi:ethionine resistance protein, partial [Coemansia sp. Benny D160-2]
MTNPEAQQSNSIQEINERPDNDETAPLLSTSISDLDITIAKNDTTEPFIQVAKGEFGYISAKSIFTTLTLLMEMSFYTVNMIAVGHLGAKALGAMAISITFNIVVATAPIMGLASTLDTFCSTAFTASRDKTLVGFHYQRGIIAIFTHFVIATPIMWNAK